MKGMYRIALFAFLGAAAFAQTDVSPAEKPPAGLEQAVRTRVNEFYSMMLNHQYRKAEAWIAEDTKDYYYGGQKPEIRKYEVLTIEFSEHFTHAKAITRVSEPVVVAGFPPSEMTVNIPSLWKIENGNWCLYEDPEKITNPSGLRTKIQAVIDQAAAANAAGATPALPEMPRELPKDPSFVLGKIQVDKPAVTLAAGTAETVSIVNGSSGPVTLELGYPLQGIEAKLDRTEVPRGERAVLTLTAGKAPGSGAFYLRVMPTGEAIRIQVQVK
jgi:hypothetical protein